MSFSFSFEDELDSSIDLTPLIDTVFMLLIFFIMATTFSKPVLEVALQEAKGAMAHESTLEPLTITITSDGRLLCNEQDVLPSLLDAFMQERPKGEAIVFRVDKQAPFGVFVTALDVAKKYGKENIAIEAEHYEQQKK